MTVNDTSYFLSNPKQWDHQADPNKHHNTFLFLRHTLYQTHGTYTIEEIATRLENSLPCTGSHGIGQTGATVKEVRGSRKDRLPGANVLEPV